MAMPGINPRPGAAPSGYGWMGGIGDALRSGAETVLGPTGAAQAAGGFRKAGQRLAGLAKPGPWAAALPLAAIGAGATALSNADSDEPQAVKVGEAFGAGAGSLALGALGSVFGPAGTIAGSIAGDLLGSSLGGTLARGFEAPEDKAKREFRTQLARGDDLFNQQLGQQRQVDEHALAMKYRDAAMMDPFVQKNMLRQLQVQDHTVNNQAHLAALTGLLNSNASHDAANIATQMMLAGTSV